MGIINGSCGYCNKLIWFFQKKGYLQEGYGDGKALCHIKCYGKCIKERQGEKK